MLNMKPLIIFPLIFIFLLTSCYDYNVDVVYSTYKGHLIIKKVVYEDQTEDDGYFYYLDSLNAKQQSLNLFICAIDCNQTLDSILWSENGKSFVFVFHGTNSSIDGTDFSQKAVLFNVQDGLAKNILEMKNKDIVDYFFTDSTFNYVCSDNTDTIKVKLE